MNTTDFMVLSTTIYLSNALISNYLGRKIGDAEKPFLNFKPFNCAGCLSFWFTFFFGIGWAFFFTKDVPQEAYKLQLRYALAVWGLGTGILNYLSINSKIQINE